MIIKIEGILKIADIHVGRINSAIKHIHHFFPMTEQILKNLSEEDIAWVDLLVNRFGKLQDIIGSKIIDLFLEEQEEPIETLTLLDKIHRLERLQLIESADLWKEMRRTRNHIAHEYPDTPFVMANHLNRIFELTPKLLFTFEKIKQSCLKYGDKK